METLMYEPPVIKEKALLLLDESTPVESVYVGVWSDEEIQHEAATEVKFVSGEVNSMDSKLGATEKTPCTTCNLEHPRCPGHWGYIDLHDTFFRSAYVHKKLVQMIFSCVCIHCHRPYFDYNNEVPQTKGSRLAACFEYVKGKTGGKAFCSVCDKPIYGVVEEVNRNPVMNRFSEMTIGSKDKTMPMPLKVLKGIFAGLTNSDRKVLGIQGVETNDFFFTKLPVLPNNVRPNRNFEGREEAHQFTILFNVIAKCAAEMQNLKTDYKTFFDGERELYYEKIYLETISELDPGILTVEEKENLPERLQEVRAKYNTYQAGMTTATDQNRYNDWVNKRRELNLHIREFDNQFGQQTFQTKFSDRTKFTPILKKSEGVGVDMNALLKSKFGLVREKIMGKRVNFCARTVASPAPFRSRSDEVWVPEKFRNTLLMTEVVTSELRTSLKRMAENKMILYVVLKDVKHIGVPFRGERTRWSEFLRYLRSERYPGNPIDYLVNGDEIERQLIEGVNYVLLNRQPSIWRYSLGAFRVRFWANATIGVPDVALKAFNGDFDGDEFNLWTIRDNKTEAEIIQLFSPVRNVLGNARNSTAYGLHYDPVTGVYLITRVIERKIPLPNIEADIKQISTFLGSIESQYFEEQDGDLNTRRYLKVFLREEGSKKVIVFSSEAVVPRDYFIDEVKEHISNMKGGNLTSFHEKLRKRKLFFVPESEINTRDLGRSYSGRAAFSLLLPDDFYFDNGKVKIEAGVLIKGTVSKSEIGAFSHNTIFHELTRLYGYEICAQVMDCLVWFTKTYLTRGNTLSFGLEDYGFVGREAERETDRVVWVRKLVSEYQSVYNTLKTVAESYRPELENQGIRLSKEINKILSDIRGLRATEEVKGFLAEYCTAKDEESARNLLLAAATLEEKNESLYLEIRAKVEELERQKKEAIAKRENNKVDEIEGKIIELLNGIRAQEAKNIESVVDPDNAFLKCEGKRGNIFEVMGSVGLQTVSGKRIYTGSASNRALPSIFPGDTSPEALGMVLGNFTRGLDPSEAAFLSWAARIGPVVTKTQTSVIGDIANRMTNAFQGIVMRNGLPQETIRENANCVQMSYGYDNLDPKFLVVRKGDQQFDSSIPASQRTDYRPDKPGQTAIDVANIQVRLDSMPGPKSQLKTEAEVALVNEFLKTRVINQYSRIEVPTDGSVYVVSGASFLVVQKSVENVRNMLRQAIMNLKFPEGDRKKVIEDTLEDIISRITGVKNKTRVVGSVQITQGEKVGRYISGAIQQPIMQAALNSVVWEEKMLIRRGSEVIVEPIGQFIDRFLFENMAIQHYPLNNTEYLDVAKHGFEIQSVDEAGKVSWKLIEAMTRHDVPEGGLVRVKTVSGREVTATIGKSFLVRRNNKIVQINGSELKIGDRLPVTRQAPEVENPIEILDVTKYFPKEEFVYSEEVRKAVRERDSGKSAWWTEGKKSGMFNLPYGRSDSLFVAINNGKIDMVKDEIYNMNGKKSSKIPCNILLDELAGFFFGAFLADGCANEYQVIISKKDEKFRSKVLAFAARYDIPYHTVINESRNVASGESFDIRFHSQMWAKVLREECGVGAVNKKVSPWMVLANKKFVKGVLDGYFSGDGTVNKRCYSIIASSASKDLLLGMTELLARFGIVSKISGHTLKSNNIGSDNILPVHTLTIRNEHSKTFFTEIGLSCSYKMELLTNIVKKDLSKTLGLYEKVPLRLSNDDEDREYTRRELTTLIENSSLSTFDQAVVQAALDSDVYFDEIVSLESASTTENHPKVYDFTIKDTRNFASFGGLHNADTFHASGQASSASSVKDRFIRLVTASSSGKRSGTMIMNETPRTFYEGYGIRNKVRELSLASILKDPAPEMYYGVPFADVPEKVKKLLNIEYAGKVDVSGNVSYLRFLFDPLILKTGGLSTVDLKRFFSSLSAGTKDSLIEFYPIFTKEDIYIFTNIVDITEVRDAFQRNIVSRLSDHKLNFGYRLSGADMEEIYPTEFKITEGIKNVYKLESTTYVVQMNARHMNRYGYTLEEVSKMFEAAGVPKPQIDKRARKLVFENVDQSPVKTVESKLSSEAEVVEAEWKASIDRNDRREPKNPGEVTKRAVGYYLKTIGGDMKFMMRNPFVNYRSSYTDGILDIEETLGLRAARNFMLHEIEQIFALSGSNEIDYRHVVLMIDSMVSQGSISRLTFQGVDKIAGPNPLNQAGVGFAPTTTFAVAALKKKDFKADVGYAVNFLASRPKLVRETAPEEARLARSQQDKVKDYLSRLPTKKTAEKPQVDYQVLRQARQRERQVLETVVPVTPYERPEPEVSVCTRPNTAYSRAFDYDISEFFDGADNGLDVFGQPTEL